jgi:hypothetical protein
VRSRAELAGLSVLVGVTLGCGGQSGPDCLALPCPLPAAITLNVTSAGGGPVADLTLHWGGNSVPCTAQAAATTCVVPGAPGTYSLELAAPGFADKALTVVVPGSTPPCGCPSVEMQRVDVVLTPL